MSFAVRPRLRTFAVCSALFAGTVLLFSRAAEYGFLNYDDPSYILNNGHVKAGLAWSSLVWAFTGHADYWHPLTWLSHMLDWQLYGPVAYGHHLTSLGWHAANAVLAFFVLRRLTGAYWTSAFAAALFAWHPLRVESVVWVTERKDVMSGCFFLLTLWAYAAYAERRRAGRTAWHHYGLTLALFVAGLMSKPMLVTLPAVLLLLDFWPLRRAALAWPPAAWRGLVVEKLPFFALSAVVSILTILMQTHTGAFRLQLSLASRLANAFVSLARYLGKFFWPADLTLLYPHPGAWPAVAVAAAFALSLALTLLAWRQRTRRPWLLTGWLWFVVVLLPVLGLLQVGLQAMADRYTYLAILGIELALLWTMREWRPRPLARGFAAAGGAVLLGACAVRTWAQQAFWRDPVVAFQHAIAVTERNDAAHAFLAYTYLALDRLDDAATESQTALELNPRNEAAVYTLANVRDRQGRLPEAIAHYRAALELAPDDPQTEYRLGLALARAGQRDEALRHLTAVVRAHADFRAANLGYALREQLRGRPAAALDLYEAAAAADPNDAAAQLGLAVSLTNLGRIDEAIARYRTVLQLDPKSAQAHVELGTLLLTRRAPEEAAKHFRAALAVDSALGLAHFGLARAAGQLGQSAEAAASLEQAIRYAPNHPAVQRAWAESLARRGHFSEAVSFYQKAVPALPGDASLRAELGYALLLSARRDEALAQFEEALRLDPDFPRLRERLERLRQ
jgi:tetratricopeptide (TPR) repeat protein